MGSLPIFSPSDDIMKPAVGNRAFFRILALAGSILFIGAGLSGNEQTPDEFFNRVQKAIESKSIPAYLDLCVPEIRDEESSAMDALFRDLSMTTVKVRRIGRIKDDGSVCRVYAQVLFQCSYSLNVENWQMSLGKAEDRWRILKKERIGAVSELYRIQIPADRTERAASVDIRHADVHIAFENAAVFYDNIPDKETALLVIGKGRLRFSPSSPVEKHQLQLLYDREELDDRLEYVFVRCSNSFFRDNIQIHATEGKPRPQVTNDERELASAVFARNYPRSFAIESSFENGLLSTLPQGDEAVFEFKGSKSGEMAYIYFPFAEEEINLFDRAKNRTVCLYSTEQQNGEKLRRFFVDINEKYDLRHYDIDVDYHPQRAYLSVKARIHVSSKFGDLETLRFRLDPDLEIVRIFDEEERDLFYTRDRLRKLLYVYFIRPVVGKQPTWIEIIYRGKIIPPVPPTDVSASLRYPSDSRIRFKPKYETFLFTPSAHWYPALPDNDFFTSRTKIIVPPGYTCVAGGTLVEKGRLKETEEVIEVEKIGSSYFTFENRSAAKSLSFIIGKFVKVEEGNDPIPMDIYVSQDIFVQQKGTMEKAKDILVFYQNRFGAFPFDRLSFVHRLWASGGGHSPASFIVLNEIPWAEERDRPLNPDSPVNLTRWNEYFLAHEIAHQWWGQGVSWDSYRDQWLSEGLAQYSAALYLKEKYGEDAFRSILKKFSKWTEKKSGKGPIIMGSRLSFYDFDGYQAVIYDKSSLVLNMLRELLGDETFFASLRRFFRDHARGEARTEQFISSLETSAGRGLQPFFRPWFFSYELPHVRIFSSGAGNGRDYELRIRIQQLGRTFIFPLWLEWEAAGRKFRTMLSVDKAGQEFVVKTGVKPDKIAFNPDRAVPGKFVS